MIPPILPLIPTLRATRPPTNSLLTRAAPRLGNEETEPCPSRKSFLDRLLSFLTFGI